MWPLFGSAQGGLSVPGPGGVGVESGGESFSPEDISGLVAYFDVSTGMTLDATPPLPSISQWVSSTGSSVLSQGTKTRQPVEQVNTFGTAPGLFYDSSLVSDLSFNASGCALIRQVSGFTAVLVCRPDAVSTDSLLEFSIAGSNSVRWGLSLKSTGGQNQLRLSARRQDSDSLATLTGTVPVNVGSYSVVAATVDYTNGLGAVYVNGQLAGSQTNLVSSGSGTDGTDANGAKLGRATAGGAIFDGMLGDVLIYQQALTLADVQAVTQWLEDKLGL